jgi:DegV family protein with EDD domain
LIDSKQVTMALGWLVILAARAARDGHTLDEVRTLVEDALPRVHVIGALNTLEYAQRGGRLGKGAALVGTLLHVKPLISIVGGEIVPVENTRSQKRALERLVEIVLGSGPIQEIAVINAAGEELAQKVKRMLASTLPEDQIVMTETGPVLGAHVGPNGVGIAWLTGKY